MEKPFSIDYGTSRGIIGLTGLIIPIDEFCCQIIWSDGETEEAIPLIIIHRFFKTIKKDLTEQEILAWRLKYGN